MQVIMIDEDFYIQRCKCGALLRYSPRDMHQTRVKGISVNLIECPICHEQAEASCVDVLSFMQRTDLGKIGIIAPDIGAVPNFV